MIDVNAVNMERYKNSLIGEIKKKLTAWLELGESNTLPNEELYRFLHSIKGTAGTLEMGGLMAVSDQLLDELKEDGGREWTQQELKNFLFELVELTYEYEHFNETETKEKSVRDSDAPLIQIIDDDISMLILLKDIMEEKGWMVLTNTDPIKATHQYFEVQPDCLILDIQLPEKDGYQVLQDIHLHNEKYFIPKIMISTQNDKQSRIKAYEMGADDFISKPLDIEEFLAKMERHIQRKRIFDQSVLIDEMTQVYNRRFLEHSLPRYFADFKRTGQPFTVSILDLDHFKRVNDTYGHAMGDVVLMEFARFMKKNLRSTDLVCRYGGEEFVAIFPRTESEDAKRKLTELIRAFSEKTFLHEGVSFSVSFSAGIFTVDNENVREKTALEKADASLYEAKRLGRCRVESIQESAQSRQSIYLSVIDDDVIIRTIIMKALQSLEVHNFEVDIAGFESGPAFLKDRRAKATIPHFLILDGVMPEMDGIEVLKEVKQGENSAYYTVLMLTGRKSREDRENALKYGADDYVTKPFTIKELQSRMERLLARLGTTMKKGPRKLEEAEIV